MKRTFTALAVAAVTVATTAATTAAAGTQTASAAPTGTPVFGYHKVRAGVPAHVARFHVESPDLAAGTFPAKAFSDGFGCTGKNVAPRLRWSGAPAGTKSFAVTMFDRDAPTGSGFWHWAVRGIPASATSIPKGVAAGANDTGERGYLGPCPPAGDRPHRYEVTVLALDVADAGVPRNATPALASFALSSHVIGYARITVTAKR
ncbi:YbhB/YbcL family Raf kinase inhibitor-like protein [Microbispora hainanensis]|uniref:YbhB/YbcL family Raf kinase inhibitor-like protein n=1 Tax=Microbispora hainanensis TaxID=568844 RepID=UPI0033F6AE5B